MLRSFSQVMSIFCFSVSFAGLLSAPANAQESKQDCAFEVVLKSSSRGAAVELSFRNASAESRRLYWLDANGNRKFIVEVAPGTELLQPTSAGSSWVATDNADKCLHVVTATEVAETIDIGDVQTADVPAPVSDVVAQSLVQTPSDVPSPGVANPVSQARALPDPSDNSDAAAAQEDAGTLPQISPIEQFHLSGAYHITPRVDSAKMLNGPISGAVDVSPLKPAWDGGRWAFEAVSGTPFVRIKNTWKNTYLGDANGSARASHVPPDASETHWTVEPVDGTPYIQFRNRETDRFLLVGRPLPVLADNIPPEQDNESHWQVIGINTGVAALASPPPDPTYESALTGCRDVGGYWTGSSCRRPSYAREPLACPRGFVWADDIGECVWNEAGRCPPWQRGPGGSCGSNLACNGGSARLSGRGHRACYCRPGAVAWGRYPNLSCVPSVARIAPLLVPLAVGGATVAILGSRPGRRTIGSLFGNRKFGRGQIGANTPVGFKTISLRGSGTTTPTTKPVSNNSAVTTGNPATQSQGTAPTTVLTPSQKAVSDFQKLTPEAKASVLNSCKGNTGPGCAAINAAASGTSTANKPNLATNPATGITTAKSTTGTPPNTATTAPQGNAGLDKAVSDYQKMTPENKTKVLAACKGDTGPGCSAINKAAGVTSTANNPNPVTNAATGITTAKPTTGTPQNATTAATPGQTGQDKAVTDFKQMTPENQGKVLAACKGNTGPGCAAIIKASTGGTSTTNPNLVTNPATGTTTAKPTSGTPGPKGTQGTVGTPPNKPAGSQATTSTDNKKLPPPQAKKETVAASKPIPAPKQTTVKPVAVKHTTAPSRPAVRPVATKPVPPPKKKLLPGERNT
jgi:protein tyrosine phosphatase (PTP) superfamily phosphohydrolase (DUF442 family)